MLIGGSGSLMDSMITRLHKEGHRVFVLTSNKDKTKRNKYVFEYYRFLYDNDSVPQVFESVRPEVTLYLGAFDPDSAMRTDAEEVHYFSGVTNMLASFSILHKGRFVYLSTSAIYEMGGEGLIEEDEKPNFQTTRSLVLTQAEEICDSYRRNLNLDVVTLRMDPIYAVPASRSAASSGIAQMCLQALEKGKVVCTSGNEYSVLYEADAVEFIHRVMFCHTHQEGLYNISASEAVTENMIAGFIGQSSLVTAEIVTTDRDGISRILSNKRYNDEFGMRFFSNPQKMVEKTLLYMKENPDQFREKKEKKKSLVQRFRERLGWLVSVLLPYFENMVCFIPFFILNNQAMGSRYFDRLDFFLLYVLLFAVVYGQRQATFSAILATAGYVLGQMYSKSSFEVFSSYSTYVWLAQLFIVGLVVGYLKDKLMDQRVESTEEQYYLKNRFDDILDINRSNVHVKNSLQTQIINQNNSIGKVYDITSTLNQYTTEEVLFHAAEILSKLMETKDVAVYLVSNDDYARLFSSTSEKSRSMGRSIRYRETGEMFETLSRRQVFINRKLDQSLPMMANAIFEEDEIQIIVMAWGIPWEAMTLGQANLMSVISALIREAVLRASRYMNALESQRYETNNNILNKDAFRSLVNAFGNAHERGLTDITILKYSGEDAFDRCEEIRAHLRQSDYFGTMGDGSLYMLLPNANTKDAQFAINRLAASGFAVSIVEDLGE